MRQQNQDRPPWQEVARNALAQHHPDARCTFIAGSITRGGGTASSDIDIVVLYGPEFADIHRDTVEHQQWLIEFFVQNEQAQNFFFDKDRQRGTPSVIHMVASGIIMGPDLDYARERQTYAQSVFAAGPKPWDQANIDHARYAVSSDLDDLADPQPYFEQQTIIAKLSSMMVEFFLATRGLWRGNGKHAGRRLAEVDPDLAEDFSAALRAAHNGDMDKLIAMGHKILDPYGGYLQAGYKAAAPIDWKIFSL